MRCIALLVVVACSSRSGDSTHPHGSGRTGAGSAAANTGAAPSEQECATLVTHAVTIGVAEQRQQLPPDQHPSEAELQRLVAELRTQFETACQRGSRDGYRCAIASKTLAELATCQSAN